MRIHVAGVFAVAVSVLASTSVYAGTYYLRADPEILERIRAFRPDVLGISTTTDERHNARYWKSCHSGSFSKIQR